MKKIVEIYSKKYLSLFTDKYIKKYIHNTMNPGIYVCVFVSKLCLLACAYLFSKLTKLILNF